MLPRLRLLLANFICAAAVALLLPQLDRAQQSQPMATNPAQPPSFDPQHRPITAGGTVSSGPIVFQNIAEQAGLTRWRNVTGTPQKRVIIEAKGSGVCLLDFDHDGWLDIYLVTGSTFEALNGKGPAPHAALFRNNHDGTFTDVTAKAGVGNDRWGLGCAVGDFDNDGWPDLYVTNLGGNRLFHNNRDGTFTDKAEQAGVALKPLPGVSSPTTPAQPLATSTGMAVSTSSSRDTSSSTCRIRPSPDRLRFTRLGVSTVAPT